MSFAVTTSGPPSQVNFNAPFGSTTSTASFSASSNDNPIAGQPFDGSVSESGKESLKEKLVGMYQSGTTVLIVAGVVTIALGALFIWPAVIALRQSKRMGRFEKSTSGADLFDKSQRPSVCTANVMAVLTAALGALGVLVGIAGFVAGFGSVSLAALLSVAMLVVGAVAAHRFTRARQSDSFVVESRPYKKVAGWSRAASILWIVSMALGLILPGLAAITFGSILKSKV